LSAFFLAQAVVQQQLLFSAQNLENSLKASTPFNNQNKSMSRFKLNESQFPLGAEDVCFICSAMADSLYSN
jgi:hypothetical protein